MTPHDFYGWSRSFAIFRGLEEEPLYAAFLELCKEETPENYGAFVNRLYETGTSNWTKALTGLVLNLETPLSRLAGQKKKLPEPMRIAAKTELKVLEEMAQAIPDTFDIQCYKPGWTIDEVDLYGLWNDRLKSMQKHGYGMYASHHMFRLKNGNIVPVDNPDRIRLSNLTGYDRQKEELLSNTKALLAGLPASNALLYGDAGTGKSATVKAVANELKESGLRLIELQKKELHLLPELLDRLATNPCKFILFIDDLSFQDNDDDFAALKAVLEGSASCRSLNTVVYATSNRRHIVRETFKERAGDDVHRNDTMQESVSLSERFGLRIYYEKPDRHLYRRIVEELAQQEGLEVDNLDVLAEQFALRKAGRSGRAARQLIDRLKGEQAC